MQTEVPTRVIVSTVRKQNRKIKKAVGANTDKGRGNTRSPLIPISSLVIGLLQAVPSDSGDGASQTNTRRQTTVGLMKGVPSSLLIRRHFMQH